MFWQIALIIILSFVASVLSIQFFYIVFRGYAPFFLTKASVMKKIINEISIKENSNVYELGCGNAGFLRAVEKKFPNVGKLIGIEGFLTPYLIGRIQTSLLESKIKIIKEDIFETDIKDADVIYCYLNPKTMKDLKEKFQRECKPGAKIISNQFGIEGLNSEKVFKVNDNENDKVYFYSI